MSLYSGSRLHDAHPGVSEPAEDVSGRDLSQPVSDGVVQVLLGPRADTPQELRTFIDAYPQRMALDAANALAFLCTSPYDVRLAQERFPKIHFHPLREHAGLALHGTH